MFATDLKECNREDGMSTPHVSIQILSPGKDEDELKDQDRMMLAGAVEDGTSKCQYAIVCDGTTTSPFAAAAAEYVSRQVLELFQENGLQRAVEILKERRRELLEKPLNIEEGHSSALRSLYEEIVKQKFQSAFQTTFIAVCLKRDEHNSPGTFWVKAMGCGDSALFIFRDNGDLVYNNTDVESQHDSFKHDSPFTAVLPDCYDKETNNVLFDFTEHPDDIHLLLCSDGFYDGFTNFSEMYQWLHEHRSELEDLQLREECLSRLHRNLNEKKGDDDISFIWLQPASTFKTLPGKQNGEGIVEPTTITSPQKGKLKRSVGFLRRMFASLVHFFRTHTFELLL